MNPNSPITGPSKIVSIEIPQETFYAGKGIDRLIGTTDLGTTVNLYPGTTLGLKVLPSIFKAGEQEVQISMNNGDDKVEIAENIAAVNPSPISATLIQGALNNKYFKGSMFKRAGIILKITYDSGDSREIGSGSIIVSPEVLSEVGTQTVTYTYTENGVSVSTTEDVEVYEDFANFLIISKYPSKLSYTSGEDVDLSGAEFTAILASGKREDVTSMITYSPLKITSDDAEIIVSYQGVDASIPVSVIGVEDIVISGLKDSYNIGEKVSDIQAKAILSDGSKKDASYEINGQGVTEYIVTKDNLKDGIEITATAYDKSVVVTADVNNIADVADFDSLKDAVSAVANNGTVKVSKNISVVGSENKVTIPAEKKVTLDLYGHDIEASNAKDIEVSGGELILIDSVGTGKIYSSVDYDSTHASGIISVSSGTFTMKSGNIYAVRDDAVNKGQFAVTYGSKDSTAVVNIEGGIITAGWYAVAGNGTYKAGSEVNITGGTLISTADYVIYQPDNCVVNISGANTIIDGAAGAVCTNNGTLNITNGQFASKGTGDTGSWSDGTGGLGDVAIYLNAKYGDSVANISGGTFIAEKEAISLKAGSAHTATFNLSGGTYSTDPSSFITEDYKVVENPDGTFTVVLA